MTNKTMVAAACVALAWAIGNLAGAVPVGTDDAAYAVDAWVAHGGTLGARLGGVVRVDAHVPANGAKFYAVKTSGGGTVFTSADTEDEPIMAFTSSRDDFSKIDEKSPLWTLLTRERSAARPALKTAAKSAAKVQSAAATKWSKLVAEGKARAAAAANGVVFPRRQDLPRSVTSASRRCSRPSGASSMMVQVIPVTTTTRRTDITAGAWRRP